MEQLPAQSWLQRFPARIAELNAIVHPVVLDFEDDGCTSRGKRPDGVAMCEAALLIEAEDCLDMTG